jgi:hypothetical protein
MSGETVSRTAFAIAAALAVAALLGPSLAPTVSAATTYNFDITKTIRGYTFHIVGRITIDEQAKTVTGHIEITVTDRTGKVIYEAEYDFTYTWSSTPRPIRFVLPGANLLVTISFSGMGVRVTAVPLLDPRPWQSTRARLDRVE